MSGSPELSGPSVGAVPPAALPSDACFPVALYAKYERGRGGLLHVLQGLLWLAQAALVQRVQIQSGWSLLFFLPVCLVYFPARLYLWRRLYRPYGHVESEVELLRLGAMAILCAGYQADFTFLKEALGATDSNLAAHLRMLEEVGYVEAAKRFVDRRPNTLYKATPAGREAFLAYGRMMRRILPDETGIR